MESDLDASYLGEMEVRSIELPASSIRIGEGVIAVAPLKTGIARFLPTSLASQECLKGSVQPPEHILQDMRSNVLVFLSDFVFDFWKIVLLIVVTDRLARIPVSILAF